MYNLIILTLLLFISCKSEEKQPSFVEIRGVGSVNFGKVTIGETRTAGVLVNNQTDGPINVNYTNANYPFSINSYQTTCKSSLPARTTCYVAIDFSPTSKGFYNLNFKVNDTAVNFTGNGTTSGELSVDNTSWDVPISTVGTLHTKRFTFTNIGDQRVLKPKIDNKTLFTEITSNCLSHILPSQSCYMDVLYQNTLSGNHELVLTFKSDSILLNIPVSGSLNPSNADGLVEFENIPQYIKTNGTDEKTIQTKSVKDIFKNNVAPGTACMLSGVNIEFPDGPNITLDSDARALFRIKATTTKAAITVSVNCQQAYGTFNIKASAEEAFGVISVEPFGTVIRADGISSSTIKTQQIKDIHGSVINDGDLVYFEVKSGNATLDKFSATSFNGKAQVRVISPTLVGNSVIKIKAAPKYDSNSNIIGWGAESEDLVINFIAGYPQGDFPITTSVPTIYFKKDPLKSYVDEAKVIIGPITDENNNNAGAGKLVEVLINGGKNKSNDLNEFNILTNSNSQAEFDIVGVGVSGFITISVTIGSKTKVHQFYLSEERESRYIPTVTSVELFKTFYNGQFSNPSDSVLNPINGKWKKIDFDLASIENADSFFWGTREYIGLPRQIAAIPYISDYNCFQSVGQLTHILPCPTALTTTRDYWGWDYPYIIGVNEEMRVARNNNIPMPFNDPNAMVRDATLFAGVTYHSKADRYVFINGMQFDYLNSSSPLYSLNTMFSIGYPTTLYSQFATMNFSKKTSSISNIGMMGIYSESFGDTYIYGGLNSSYSPTGNLYRIKYENLDLKTEQISVQPHEVYGVPSSTINSTVYTEDGFLYVVGGISKVSGSWEINDTIWKVNLKSPSPKWQRVCSTCGLPQSTDVISHLLFPLANASGDLTLIQGSYKKSKIFKDMSNKRILHVAGIGMYSINLDTGLTDPINDEYLNLFKNKEIVHFNENTGRYVYMDSNSKLIGNNQLMGFDAGSNKRPFYMIKHNLGTDAYFGAQRFQFDTGVIASVLNEDQSEIFGAEIYAFNFVTNSWEALAQSLSALDGETITAPTIVTKNLNTGSRELINSQGNVYLMVFPSENTGISAETLLKLNHSIIRGVW